MNIIEKTKDLEEFCKKIKTEQFITIDLEFLREKTYYAILCLIQVGSKDSCAIIDPLAKDINLDCFFELLEDKNIVKVFHSCRQDIEILYKLTGKIPQPLFDTQIAAMVCGFGESVSYETLVNKITNKELDKTSRLSNWQNRPLSEKQLKYAMSDVTHLVVVYEFLKKSLEKNNRSHWIDEEMKILHCPQTYYTNPMEVWQKIKHRSHNRKFLTLLQALAGWREERSIQKDNNRQAYIKDDCLLNIASIAPTNKEELMQIRNIRGDIVSGKLGIEIIEVVKNFKKIDSKDYVELNNEKNGIIFSAALFELLKLLLKIVSQNENVVPRLIASDEDLKDFASDEICENNPILKGWRNEIFGIEALKLRNGEISIRYDVKKKKIDIQ